MTTLNTTRFRFTDEAAAKAALAEYVDASGQWITGSHVHALDPIGTLFSLPVIDPSTGAVTTPSQPLPGWHVNLIGDVPADAVPSVIAPATPLRVFA